MADLSQFFQFWMRCLVGAFEFALTELAYIDGICIFIGLVIYFRRNKSHRRIWEQILEGFVRKFASIFILGQLVLCVFLVAPYIQFHDEQEKIKHQDLAGKSENNYLITVTNASQSTFLNGVYASNLTVSENYSNHYEDTNQAVLEIGIITNLETLGFQQMSFRAIINLPRSRQINLVIKNVGTKTAFHPLLGFSAPLSFSPTNLIANQWFLQKNRLLVLDKGKSLKFNRWQVSAVNGFILPGGTMTADPLVISTNYPGSSLIACVDVSCESSTNQSASLLYMNLTDSDQPVTILNFP